MKYALNQIIKKPCVATIGTFDGVHRGHQYVVRQVVSQARQRGLESVVLTFPNHPLQVLQDGFQPQMLTLPQEKREASSPHRHRPGGDDAIHPSTGTDESLRLHARRVKRASARSSADDGL